MATSRKKNHTTMTELTPEQVLTTEAAPSEALPKPTNLVSPDTEKKTEKKVTPDQDQSAKQDEEFLKIVRPDALPKRRPVSNVPRFFR